MSHNNYTHTNQAAWIGEWARDQYGEIGYKGQKKARWAGGGQGMVDTPSNELMTGWTAKVKNKTNGTVEFLSWDHDDAQSKPKKVSVQVGWIYTPNFQGQSRARWGANTDTRPFAQPYVFNWVGMDQPEIFCDPAQPFTKQTSQNMVANEKNFTLIKAGCICKFDGQEGNNNIAQLGIYTFYRKGTFNKDARYNGCTIEYWQAMSNGAGGVNWVKQP
jgi:hypothetical protein